MIRKPDGVRRQSGALLRSAITLNDRLFVRVSTSRMSGGVLAEYKKSFACCVIRLQNVASVDFSYTCGASACLSR